MQALDFLVAERAGQPCGIAQPQFAFADDLARADDRPGADKAVAFDGGAVEHAGAHADQAQVFDGAGMQDGAVADCDVGADHCRVARLVERAMVADVDDGAVLHVGACADLYMIDVAANHRARPHRHVIAQAHLADDGAGRIDIDACAQLRGVFQERANRGHDDLRHVGVPPGAGAACMIAAGGGCGGAQAQRWSAFAHVAR